MFKGVAASVVYVDHARLRDQEIVGGWIVIEGPASALGFGGNQPLAEWSDEGASFGEKGEGLGPKFPGSGVWFGLIGGVLFCGARPCDVKAAVDAVKQASARSCSDIADGDSLHVQTAVVDLADGFSGKEVAL